MAKKKGRRSTNVARKREKRNRDRKSRQKQLAHEKQRRLLHSRSEEEHLHACIAASQKLLDEPELENVLFDSELTQKRVVEVLTEIDLDEPDALDNDLEDFLVSDESDVLDNNLEDFLISDESVSSSPTDEGVDEIDLDEMPPPMSTAEEACDHFRVQVLPHLLTPDFINRLTRALTACETRLRRTGNRELAEVAFVTRSLFEAAPPEVVAFHPMIQTIGIETLQALVADMDLMADGREEVEGILSDVLAQDDLDPYLSESVSVLPETPLEEDVEPVIAPTSDAVASVPLERIVEETAEVESKVLLSTFEAAVEMEQPIESEEFSESEPVVYLQTVPEPPEPVPTLSPDELPARALYKNFDGLAIKESFEESTDAAPSEEGLAHYALVNEDEEKIEFVDADNERYITVTEDRLQLHARSEAELAVAMAEVEAHCTSGVMYLAKTIEERR